MIIIPAIDIKGGRCVRLVQGVAERETVYSEDPEGMARHWEEQGARWLHVVDLDGAFQGRPVHAEVVGRIARAVKIPVETGGGLRTDDDIRRLLDAGVRRAILGTRACEGKAGLARLAGLFGDRLAVGIDARDGKVQVRGWVEGTDILAVDMARMAEEAGIRTLICTDTAKDGMLGGPNLGTMRGIGEAVRCEIIASGGVASPDDVRALAGLGLPKLSGAIVGKALYAGSATLADLQAAADGGAERRR